MRYRERSIIRFRLTFPGRGFDGRPKELDSQGGPGQGMDLPVGHVHAHQYERSEAPPQCHRPVKRRARNNASSASASGGERVNMPIRPQLRVLQQESQDAPSSEDSIPSSASPRSGLVRARPYRPIDELVEGSSFELVPSPVVQAPCASGTDESLNLTPIPRSSSSPSILSKPIPRPLARAQTWLAIGAMVFGFLLFCDHAQSHNRGR